jgi:hypothetical protein
MTAPWDLRDQDRPAAGGRGRGARAPPRLAPPPARGGPRAEQIARREGNKDAAKAARTAREGNLPI